MIRNNFIKLFCFHLMTQMTFGATSNFGPEGSSADLAAEEVTTKTATSEIEFGRVLTYDDVNSLAVSMFSINKVVITNTTDLDAGDIMSLNLKITDKATGTTTNHALTTGVFSGSDATTIGVIVTAAKLLTGIASSTAYLTNVLSFVASPGYAISVDTVTYTGGSTVTKVSQVNSTNGGIIAGISKQINKPPYYDSNMALVSKYKGDIVVYSPTGFDNNDTLYIVGAGDNIGRIVNAASDLTVAAPAYITHKTTATGTNTKGEITLNMP